MMVIKTSKKFSLAYIRDLNLPPIRFVQFVPRFVTRCRLYSFIISMILPWRVLVTELYNYWRSGSPRKSEAENMADFGLSWRHMVPSATGIYHWPTAMLCFWQSPFPPGFYRKKLWLSCFRDKSSRKNSFFSLVHPGTCKNSEKMFLLTGKSCETYKFFVVLPG